MAMLEDIEIVYLVFLDVALLTLACTLCCGGPEEPADQPPDESLEQRAARGLAAHEAAGARILSVLAEQAAAARPVVLPYFPYAARGGRAPEAMECAICLEPLRQGQHCSEVPCRHVFHRECLSVWARSNGSWPMCRAKIVPGSDGAAVADNMV